MIIGITGGTGCGKTTVLNVLEENGCVVLDCDRIYHRLLETDTALLRAIKNRFPGTVTGGKLDRKKLGSIVFADKAALLDLNKITHTAVKQEVLKQLTPAPELAAIDAIGLLEGNLKDKCDLLLAVIAPPEIRVERIMAREGISREYAQSRIDAQKPNSYFEAGCHQTFNNNFSDAQAARASARELFQTILKEDTKHE